jgi:predicted nucleic acid-binding protein
MAYLLDTDTIIYWMNNIPQVVRHVTSYGKRRLMASVITRAELYYGAYRSTHVENNLAAIRKLSRKIKFMPLGDEAQQIFGRIKAELQKDGNPLADSDILIASTALANRMTLVTNNTRHFERIAGLNLENWYNDK